MFRQIIALCIIAYVVVATDKVNKEEKSATPEKTENKRALTRDVSKVAGKEAVAQAAPKAAGKEVVARDAVMSAEDYAEIGPNDRQIRKKRFRIRPRYWLRWHRRRPYYYYYYPYYPPAPVVPTTTTRSPYDDYYVYDEYCPNHADAFFTLRRYSLMFTGEDVFLIRGNTIEGVEFINEMFPAGPRTVTGAYYNDYKKMVVLFEGRNVWAYKHYPGPQFRLIAGYPKPLPWDFPFTPRGAFMWHDRRQVILAGDGRFVYYDEYWNRPLMSGNVVDYFKGLPSRVRGISNWMGDETVVYTTDAVYNYKRYYEGHGRGVPIAAHLRCL